jgi:hypothetical protein
MIDAALLEKIGVYQDPDGQYKRHRLRTVDVEYDLTDPRAEQKGLVVAYSEELVPHAVILATATDRASVEEARQKAIKARADFYHPTHGWLRWGIKRETDAPENLGAGTVRHERRRIVVEPLVVEPRAEASPAAAAPKKG